MSEGVLRGIGTLVTCEQPGGQGGVHPLSDAAIAWQGGSIVWLGSESSLPEEYRDLPLYDAHGGLVTPGLIDCHTHLAFGGYRADEFERRVRGEGYLAIAKAGGGIASTVRATREASEQELVDKALPMLAEMASLGMTTVECKSGYGLDFEQELKLLRVYRTLASEQPLELVPTFLGAHIVPPEYKSRRDEYVRLLVDRCLPAIAEQGLAEFCDVFVEETAYSLEEARHIFEAAKRLGLGIKVHADQLSDGGGAALAAELGAVSADHLERTGPEAARAMAAAGVVGVTLPFASLYTFQTPLDARPLIDAGVPVAVSTDFNPGSAPSYHLPMALNLACLLNRMTPHEALKGATLYAARAVSRQARLGSLEVGKQADLAVFDAPSVNHWLYQFRGDVCRMTLKAGRVVYRSA